ncbi:hypothetical protein CRUP_013442 [Coryphaenoides rupestris]|nr:hypothetical protein CRUP_013442 [Coryphaenoides rupestris]
MDQELKDNPDVILPESDVSGVNSKTPKAVSSDGDAETGSVVLGISERLVSALELLSPSFFKSENQTEINSDIISAFLPKTKHSNFSQPVNFTIQHKKKSDAGLVTCVYWEEKQPTAESADAADAAAGEEEASSWSVKGCWVAYSDENYTICSCSHLSTFALILQIGDVRTKYPHLNDLVQHMTCPSNVSHVAQPQMMI